MTIYVNFTTIHELVKEKSKPIEPNKIRLGVLDKENEKVQKLINGVIDLYGKKGNSAQYGIFTDKGSLTFPNIFKKYYSRINRGSNDETFFMETTSQTMNSLYDSAKSLPGSTGGYILFVDYIDESKCRIFLTAMIKQKPGIVISDNLEIEELEHIDLSKLYQASKLNFSKYKSYEEETVPVNKQELNYLSFVSPISGKEASGYFIDALGCEKGLSNNKITKTLIKESYDFFKKDSNLKESANRFKDDLVVFLQEKEKKNEIVKLSEVSTIAQKYFPHDDALEEYENKFHQHLNSEEHRIPTEFSVNKSAINSFVKITYKGINWKLQLDRHLIGVTPSAHFYYNSNDNTLTLNRIPDVLKNQIEEVLEEQSE